MGSTDVIEAHRARGRTFEAGGVRSFTLDEGSGEPVVCVHGVPTSSYLYRKVVPELADRGLRGIAFDLPGLGLAGRPVDFDYSWTGLGRFALAAVDALGLDRFHLVGHDIGGPIGFELAAAVPERLLSLTVLNSPVAVDGFHRPFPMSLFATPGVGPVTLRTMVKPVFRRIMRYLGVADQASVSDAELDAYLDLLKREDGGRAFLRIMRGFELTAEKQALYDGVLASSAYPVQIVWGELDPALKADKQGEAALRASGRPELIRLPGKHFLQEDNAPAIADQVARIAGR